MAAGLREAGHRREDLGDCCAGRLYCAVAKRRFDEGVRRLTVEALIGDDAVELLGAFGGDERGPGPTSPTRVSCFISPTVRVSAPMR